MTAPADFDAYWDAVDRELAAYAAAPEIEPLPLRTTDFATAYTVRLTSSGPTRIFGYLSVPHGDGPFPALLEVPTYGSVNHVPAYEDRRRYVMLTIMHRGQRLADQTFAAAYPGLLTLGIDDPATYVYREIVADCLRGAEFLLARPEVDARRVGVTGTDLALMVAARRPRFAAVRVTGTPLYRALDAAGRTREYPLEELNDHLRAYPDRRERVARALAYVDPLHHAPRVTASTLLSVGDPGTVGGPEWLAPLAAALGGPVEQYALVHEGRTDDDWRDAWLAERLGLDS